MTVNRLAEMDAFVRVHAQHQPLNMRLFLNFLEARFKTAAWGVDV